MCVCVSPQFATALYSVSFVTCCSVELLHTICYLLQCRVSLHIGLLLVALWSSSILRFCYLLQCGAALYYGLFLVAVWNATDYGSGNDRLARRCHLKRSAKPRIRGHHSSGRLSGYVNSLFFFSSSFSPAKAENVNAAHR